MGETEYREMKFHALDLGASVAIRVGSSPTSPTIYDPAKAGFSFWGTFLTSDHLWITGERIGIVVLT